MRVFLMLRVALFVFLHSFSDAAVATLMCIDGQKLHKNKPFIARKVANKITQSCKKKLQINKPRSLNSEILFNQNFV